MKKKNLFIVVGVIAIAIFVLAKLIGSSGSLKNITGSPILDEGLMISETASGENTSDGAEVSGEIKNTWEIPMSIVVKVAFFDENGGLICYGTDQLDWVPSGESERFHIVADTTEARSFAIISVLIT